MSITVSNWREIGDLDNRPPIGEMLLLCNQPEQFVTCGYGEWSERSRIPLWISLDPKGTGRFKPTHWAKLPKAEP